MKGKQIYFDENSEKEAESNQIAHNQTQKNNIKISLDPEENLHNFNEDYFNSSAKDRENTKLNEKSISNSQKAKNSANIEEANNEQEHYKVKNSNANKSYKIHPKQENNEINHHNADYDINYLQADSPYEKKKNSKSKKSSSNKFSNGMLEEVSNSKFIIRTNFLEDDSQDNQSQDGNQQSKKDFYNEEEKYEEFDLLNKIQLNKNSNAVDINRKNQVFIKLIYKSKYRRIYLKESF